MPRNIDDKVDSIVEVLNNHTVILTEIQKDVEYHIKRTDLLEEHVKGQEYKLEEAIKPINWAKTTGKILSVLLPIVAVWIAWHNLK